ncbi:phosphate/phosphite/phosphonate ABC transporter substrate-binding protein [Methylosoma difficile]
MNNYWSSLVRGWLVIGRVIRDFKPVILVLASALLAGNASAQEAYSVGIVPQQAAAVLARNWTPMLQYLEKATGVALRFKTAPTIPEFEKRLAEGEYDFAYMNPYHYVVFSKDVGYLAFAREKDTRLQGVVVVRKDSNITDISQLAGKDLAFPAPASFAASVLPRIQLKKQGIAFTPHFVASHDSVYFSVARGIYPAGGGVVRTLNSAPADVRDQLQVLWRTDSFIPHAFAAKPGVPEKVLQVIAKAMYVMASQPEGQSILQNLNMKGWEPAQDKDWDDLRKMPLDIADAPIQK